MKKPTYSELLLDPRWQKKRLEVLQRDGFKCYDCKAETETLHVHHRYYVSGRIPWEYPPFCYVTLCKTCHEGVKRLTEERRQDGHCMFEDWEHGLDQFGERIFDLAVEEELSRR